MCGSVSIITHTRHGWVVLVMSSPNNDPSHLWFIHSFNQSITSHLLRCLAGGARGVWTGGRWRCWIGAVVPARASGVMYNPTGPITNFIGGGGDSTGRSENMSDPSAIESGMPSPNHTVRCNFDARDLGPRLTLPTLAFFVRCQRYHGVTPPPRRFGLLLFMRSGLSVAGNASGRKSLAQKFFWRSISVYNR